MGLVNKHQSTQTSVIHDHSLPLPLHTHTNARAHTYRGSIHIPADTSTQQSTQIDTRASSQPAIMMNAVINLLIMVIEGVQLCVMSSVWLLPADG